MPYGSAPLHAPLLNRLSWLRHAFSTRTGGVTSVYGRSDDLNLGLTSHDSAANVQENRRRLLATTGQGWPLATARQIHSNTALVLAAAPAQSNEADALLTATPSLFVGILTADCVPILLADPRQRAVAAIHAGWRGTAAQIAEVAIQTMRDRFSSRPQDLLAAIGPSIGPCCYQVGEELRSHFPSSLFQEDRLDLWQANRRQLLASGLLPVNIDTLEQCTVCTRTSTGERRFFSHRAERGHTGRMMSVIGIK